MLDRGFNFIPSKLYLVILSVTLLLCAILLLVMSVTLPVKFALLLMFAVYSYHLLMTHGFLYGRSSINKIRLHEDGRWRLTDKNGQHAADLLGDSVITAWMCLLRFRQAGKFRPRSCLVFRDSLPYDEYRRLMKVLHNSPLPHA